MKYSIGLIDYTEILTQLFMLYSLTLTYCNHVLIALNYKPTKGYVVPEVYTRNQINQTKTFISTNYKVKLSKTNLSICLLYLLTTCSFLVHTHHYIIYTCLSYYYFN